MTKKLLLNKSKRDHLKEFVRQNAVPDPKLLAARDKAYEIAKDVCICAIRKEYPESDMKIIRKYNMQKLDKCVKFTDGSAGADIAIMELKTEDCIDIPRRQSCSYSGRVISTTAIAINKIRKYNEALKAVRVSRDQMIGDFDALIDAAKTFEELTAVWPKFEKVKASLFGEHALVLLNDDVKKRIASYALAESE